MTTRRKALACLAVTTLCLPGPDAVAGEPLLELDWSAPAGCPVRQQIEAQVAELLGGPTKAATHVKAKVAAYRGEDALWHVEILTLSGSTRGERKVDGESCNAVAEASALILAMAVDPDAVAAKALGIPATTPSWDPTDRPAPLPVLVAAPVGTRSAPPLPVVSLLPEPEHEAPTSGSLAPLIGLDVGALPSPSLWFGGVVSVARAKGRLELRAALLSEQSTSLDAPRRAGGTFDLTTVGGSACYEVTGPTPGLAVCGGIDVGVWRARGYGVTDPEEADPIWVSLSPRLVGTWPLGSHVSLRLEVGGGVPLRRPAFEIEPYGEVHRASPVVGQAAFGPQLHFR